MTIFLTLQAALTPWGVVGLFATITFLIVYAVRKKFGPQWERLVGFIPALGIDMSFGWVIVNKLVQALPGAIIAAGLGAVTSGASLGPTLLSALAGLLAAAGHEFAKAVPIIPYRGETSEAKLPGAPKLPTILPVLILGLSLIGCASHPVKDPCTAKDKINIPATYAAKVMEKCAGFDSLAACPYMDDLRAERAKEEERCR